MNRNVFDGEDTRYDETEEEQAPTLLDDDDESAQAETRYEDDEDRFLDTVIEDEDDEDEDEEQPDRKAPDFAFEESVRYRLGDFYVTEEAVRLGKGGQADIYRCYRKGTSETFAAKIHKDILSQDKIKVIEAIRDMENKCESIYRIYEAGYTKDESGQSQSPVYMIVTKEYEKLPPKHLNFAQRKGGKTGKEGEKSEQDYYERLKCAVEDLNNALTTMHNAKIRGSESHIYHSDIKPKNIMWDRDGRKGKGCLVLIDFDGGVVNDTDKSEINAAGTRLYMPPEFNRSKTNKVNAYTDNYSLGITLSELIAGVMPTKENLVEESAKDGSEYYEKYIKEGIEIHHLLFPPEMPEYVLTLFNGLLYYDEEIGKESQKKRWNDKMLRRWVDLVDAGRREKAAELPCGSPIVWTREKAERDSYAARPGTVSMPLDDSIKCRIPYNNGFITIRSAEEMAEQFIKFWSEIVNRLMTEEDFPSAFHDLGPNVLYNLRRAQQNMSKNPKKRDDIFDKEVIEVYLSDKFKRENLRCYRRVYTSKEEFGNKLYVALIASRDRGKNVYCRLPEGQKGKTSEFNDILTMFSKGIVSGFLTGKSGKWQVDDDTLQIIRKAEQHAKGDSLNAKTVENLYRTAFRLRGNTSHIIDKRTYKDYAEFSRYLLSLAKSDMESAVAVQEKCLTGDGRLKVDMYAWMQETEGVVVHPTEKDREQF